MSQVTRDDFHSLPVRKNSNPALSVPTKHHAYDTLSLIFRHVISVKGHQQLPSTEKKENNKLLSKWLALKQRWGQSPKGSRSSSFTENPSRSARAQEEGQKVKRGSGGHRRSASASASAGGSLYNITKQGSSLAHITGEFDAVFLSFEGVEMKLYANEVDDTVCLESFRILPSSPPNSVIMPTGMRLVPGLAIISICGERVDGYTFEQTTSLLEFCASNQASSLVVIRFLDRAMAAESKFVICRICESAILATTFERHSKYCMLSSRNEVAAAECNKRLLKLVDAIVSRLEQNRGCSSGSCSSNDVDFPTPASSTCSNSTASLSSGSSHILSGHLSASRSTFPSLSVLTEEDKALLVEMKVIAEQGARLSYDDAGSLQACRTLISRLSELAPSFIISGKERDFSSGPSSCDTASSSFSTSSSASSSAFNLAYPQGFFPVSFREVPDARPCSLSAPPLPLNSSLEQLETRKFHSHVSAPILTPGKLSPTLSLSISSPLSTSSAANSPFSGGTSIPSASPHSASGQPTSPSPPPLPTFSSTSTLHSSCSPITIVDKIRMERIHRFKSRIEQLLQSKVRTLRCLHKSRLNLLAPGARGLRLSSRQDVTDVVVETVLGPARIALSSSASAAIRPDLSPSLSQKMESPEDFGKASPSRYSPAVAPSPSSIDGCSPIPEGRARGSSLSKSPKGSENNGSERSNSGNHSDESDHWTTRANSAMMKRSLPRAASLDSSNNSHGSRIQGANPTGNQSVRLKDFEILKPISKGAFGRVFLATKRSTGDRFAMKVLAKEHIIRKKKLQQFTSECNILASTSSPFVIKLYWILQSCTHVFLVMEYSPGGDLLALLKNIGALEETVARFYLAETVLALRHLHENGCVHRDLKPDNLLIGMDGHIKLTDFGLSEEAVGSRNIRRHGFVRPVLTHRLSHESPVLLLDTDYVDGTSLPLSLPSTPTGSGCAQGESPPSRTFSSKQISTEHEGNQSDVQLDGRTSSMSSRKSHGSRQGYIEGGTPDYLSPEIILSQPHGKAVDFWALGVIMYELIMGIPPFNDDSVEQIFENILNKRIEWPPPEDMSFEARELIDKLLCYDPDERYGQASVMSHPFFESVDWETIRISPPPFVPSLEDQDDTSYFDNRQLVDMLTAEELIECNGSTSGSEDEEDDVKVVDDPANLDLYPHQKRGSVSSFSSYKERSTLKQRQRERNSFFSRASMSSSSTSFMSQQSMLSSLSSRSSLSNSTLSMLGDKSFSGGTAKTHRESPASQRAFSSFSFTNTNALLEATREEITKIHESEKDKKSIR